MSPILIRLALALALATPSGIGHGTAVWIVDGTKVGGTINLAGLQKGEKMAVTVLKVVDPATGATARDAAADHMRLIAIQLRLNNIGSATYSDSPSTGAGLVDTEGQQFGASPVRTSAGPDFAGVTTIPPGGTGLGFVVFEVPEPARIVTIQFALNSGFADQIGKWTVS